MYLNFLQTGIGSAHVTLLGYDITDGLDGEKLYHAMHPHGGSITVIGPKEERAQFRDSFLARVRDVDILWFDFSPMSVGETERQAALADLKRQVDERSAEKRPTLVVVDCVLNDPALMSYVVQLIEQMRSHNLSVYIEFNRVDDAMAVRCYVNSWTVVLVGPNAVQNAYTVSQGAFHTNPGDGYVVMENTHAPRAVPVVFP